ncbi:MAG: Ig-like domain-containing protein [Verrucomicrobia bacterium]|nr:Ig-like domain-containing protein [Verrucomicrobiota bacterium]
MSIPTRTKNLLAASISFALMTGASAVTIGFGPDLLGAQDTQSNGTNNQMRQNINITDTVFLAAGTYRATTWDYQAGEDASNGATQPVFPFLTLVNGPGDHTVLALGATIDTEPGIQNLVPFGGTDDTFVVPEGGATIAAGIQNTNADGVQNSILTDTSFGTTDHANGLNFDEAGTVGASLTSFGHANLPRTYAFSIEVEPAELSNPTPPVVTALKPSLNSTEVEITSNLVAKFDEVIVAGNGNITIKNLTDSTQIVIPVSDAQVTIKGISLTINPTESLEGGKAYAIQIDETAIDDTTGDDFTGIEDDVTWAFTTDAPDFDAPEIETLNPASGGIDIPLVSDLEATFDERIAIGSGDIVLKNLTDGTEIAIPVGDAQVSISGSVMTIDPTDDLELGKNYAVQIAPTAIDDLAGNSFVGISDNTTWNFATRIPVIGGSIIGPGADITEAIQNDIVDQERLNIDRTFTTLNAGTYNVTDWQLNVARSNDGTGDVTPMLLTGTPPSYSILWLGSAFDPDVDGIQIVPETGDFTLDAPTDIYAGFFTTNLGSEIIATDADNSGTGFSSTDHTNSFIAPTEVGETIDSFSHAGLGRTYAFEINVVEGSQRDLKITSIKYLDEETPRVEFIFNSIPGRIYLIEASTSLKPNGEPGGWIELDDGFEAEGDESTYVDLLSFVTGPRVFYRVKLMPR